MCYAVDSCYFLTTHQHKLHALRFACIVFSGTKSFCSQSQRGQNMQPGFSRPLLLRLPSQHQHRELCRANHLSTSAHPGAEIEPVQPSQASARPTCPVTCGQVRRAPGRVTRRGCRPWPGTPGGARLSRERAALCSPRPTRAPAASGPHHAGPRSALLPFHSEVASHACTGKKDCPEGNPNLTLGIGCSTTKSWSDENTTTITDYASSFFFFVSFANY
jgi:hypothetical protein